MSNAVITKKETKKGSIAQNEKREHSSVGSERLPYKQRVGGSTPSAPTTRKGKSKQNPEVYRLRDFLFIAWGIIAKNFSLQAETFFWKQSIIICNGHQICHLNQWGCFGFDST